MHHRITVSILFHFVWVKSFCIFYCLHFASIATCVSSSKHFKWIYDLFLMLSVFSGIWPSLSRKSITGFPVRVPLQITSHLNAQVANIPTSIIKGQQGAANRYWEEVCVYANALSDREATESLTPSINNEIPWQEHIEHDPNNAAPSKQWGLTAGSASASPIQRVGEEQSVWMDLFVYWCLCFVFVSQQWSCLACLQTCWYMSAYKPAGKAKTQGGAMPA